MFYIGCLKTKFLNHSISNNPFVPAPTDSDVTQNVESTVPSSKRGDKYSMAAPWNKGSLKI